MTAGSFMLSDALHQLRRCMTDIASERRTFQAHEALALHHVFDILILRARELERSRGDRTVRAADRESILEAVTRENSNVVLFPVIPRPVVGRPTGAA